MNALSQNTKINVTDINTLISECNGKLNLSGGTLTGNLITPSLQFTNSGVISSSNDAQYKSLSITSENVWANELPFILMRKIDATNTDKGCVTINAGDGTNYARVNLYPSGSFTLNGKTILTSASGKAVDSAKADYATTYLDSLGQKTAITESGTTANKTTDEIAYRGLSCFGCYNTTGTPANYGNIVQIRDARDTPGGGQLFLGWSGTDSTTAKCYYRSHRDTNGGGWGAWKEIYMSGLLSEILFANGSKLWIA